jgi:hypothetical protein
MTTTTPRLDIERRCYKLGVNFVTHSEAAPRTNVAAWARITKPGFEERVFLTVFPDIIYPDTLECPFEKWEILPHELVHWVRQRDEGLYSWSFKYSAQWLYPRFRFVEEATAFLEDIRVGRLSIYTVINRLIEWYGITSVSRPDMMEWFNANI